MIGWPGWTCITTIPVYLRDTTLAGGGQTPSRPPPQQGARNRGLHNPLVSQKEHRSPITGAVRP